MITSVKIALRHNLQLLVNKIPVNTENLWFSTYVGALYVRGIRALVGTLVTVPFNGRTGTAYMPGPWFICSRSCVEMMPGTSAGYTIGNMLTPPCCKGGKYEKGGTWDNKWTPR